MQLGKGGHDDVFTDGVVIKNPPSKCGPGRPCSATRLHCASTEHARFHARTTRLTPWVARVRRVRPVLKSLSRDRLARESTATAYLKSSARKVLNPRTFSSRPTLAGLRKAAVPSLYVAVSRCTPDQRAIHPPIFACPTAPARARSPRHRSLSVRSPSLGFTDRDSTINLCYKVSEF